MTVSDTHVCECGHPISTHPGADYGCGSCVATVLTNAPLGGGSTYQCPCKTYSEVTGNDTHADTIREALHILTRMSFKEDVDDAEPHEASLHAYASLDALVARMEALATAHERERARADRAEAKLDLALSLMNRDIEAQYEDALAGALSAGSGGREPT